MIYIACLSCALCLQVEGTDDRELDTLVGASSSFWPDKFTCSDCGGSARGLLPAEISVGAAARLRIVCVTAQEAFAAIHGLGLPVERSCHLAEVQELLTRVGVKHLRGKDILGAARCTIDYMELTDGSRVYLGPSTDGAIVYRVTRPHSYVEQVGEDHGGG